MTDPQNPSSTPMGEPKSEPESMDWMSSPEVKVDKKPLYFLYSIPLLLVILGLVFMFMAYSHDKSTATKAQTPQDPKDAQIAALQAELSRLKTPSTDPVTGLPTHGLTPVQGQGQIPAPVYADPNAIAKLSARLDRLEMSQRYVAEAAASASAASHLEIAAKGSAPFLSELAAVERSLNDTSLVSPLRPLAEKGVPSEIELALAFPKVAALANAEAKSSRDSRDIMGKLRHLFASWISVRKLNNEDGQGVEATLHRAEIHLNSGDLEGCVGYVSSLPPASQAAIKPWLDQAKARIYVDHTTREITELALTHLSQTNQATNQDLGPTHDQGGAF